MKIKSKTIILTGMHRSGTSFLGRFLLLSGVSMGANLLGPSSGNPHGYFEDVEILNFHKSILTREFGGDFHFLPKKPATNAEDEAKAAELAKIRNDQNAGPWGCKDPRTCYFLDLWKKVLPGAFFLFVYRHPLFVADSLRRRGDGKSGVKVLNAWIYYNQQILKFHHQYKQQSLIVSLEKIIQNPKKFTELLSDRTGYEFSEGVFSQAFDSSVMRSKYSFSLTREFWYRVKAFSTYQQLNDLNAVS